LINAAGFLRDTVFCISPPPPPFFCRLEKSQIFSNIGFLSSERRIIITHPPRFLSSLSPFCRNSFYDTSPLDYYSLHLVNSEIWQRSSFLCSLFLRNSIKYPSPFSRESDPLPSANSPIKSFFAPVALRWLHFFFPPFSSRCPRSTEINSSRRRKIASSRLSLFEFEKEYCHPLFPPRVPSRKPRRIVVAPGFSPSLLSPSRDCRKSFPLSRKNVFSIVFPLVSFFSLQSSYLHSL